LIGLGILAGLLLVYLPALRGGFLWDDSGYISGAWTLRTLGGLKAIWVDPRATCQYYPLSFTVFWAIYQLFGLTPLAFHLATLLLQWAAALLFWQFLARLRVNGALLAAVIFAFHPVNVMSVAWMSELKNTLSCTLALGACWAYIRFAGLGVYGQPDNAAGNRPAWRWHLLSLALFLLAMLAKTAVSFLPVTLLLVIWWQRGRLRGSDLPALLPMLAIAVGMGAFTIYIEQHAGASGSAFNIDFQDRLLISGRSFWFYLGKLAWPADLIFIYPRWKVDAGEWRQWIYPVAMIGALLGAWLVRGRIGRGVFVAIAHFYVSTSLLVMMVVPYMTRYSYVSDHWAYYGSLSVIALAAAGISRVAERTGLEWAGPLEWGIGGLICLGLATLSWAQSRTYVDAGTLWRATLAANPGCGAARNNLGADLYARGQTEEAMEQFQEAVRIDPDNAEAHVSLGSALYGRGLSEQAFAQYRQALAIDGEQSDAWYDLGKVFLDQGKITEAIASFREGLRINPYDADGHDNLGYALGLQGSGTAAIGEYRQALEIDPDHAEAEGNLGAALFQQGEASEALPHLERALELEPGSLAFENELAWILAAAPQTSVRDGTRAVELATQASQATGGTNPGVLRTLAAAYAQAGDFPDAVQTGQKALQLARSQGNTALAKALGQELKLFQAAHPL
jgi:Flp pilus assembly protein TadD